MAASASVSSPMVLDMEPTDTKVGKSPVASPETDRKSTNTPKRKQRPLKVLVAIDKGPESEQAFKWYASHLHCRKIKPILLFVAEPPYLSSEGTPFVTPDVWAKYIQMEKMKFTVIEDKFARLMQAFGISGRIKSVLNSRPGEVIVNVAQDEKVGLIVLGTRNQDSVRRTLLGSVSDYVLHHAHCPVNIYRSSSMYKPAK